jgi:hypothetical protein
MGETPLALASPFGRRPDCLTATQWLINLTEGTNKNESKVLGKVEPQVGKTGYGTPLIRVGRNVIVARCSEYTDQRREND